MRAFSEIDLYQVIKINTKIQEATGELTKADLGDIEIETVTKSIYNAETFFSLFAEQSDLYDQIWERLKEPSQDKSSF